MRGFYSTDFLGERRFIIRPGGHIICTLTISGIIYFTFKSASAFFASLIAGILIDIDHVFDYYFQRGVTLKIKRIYAWCLETEFDSLFLCLHSIELVIIFWLIISFLKLGIFWIAFAIGMTQHIVLDILFNPVYPYAYFLSYRIIRGPDKKNLLRKF